MLVKLDICRHWNAIGRNQALKIEKGVDVSEDLLSLMSSFIPSFHFDAGQFLNNCVLKQPIKYDDV